MENVTVNNQGKGVRNALRRIRRKAAASLSLAMIGSMVICSQVFATPAPVDFSDVTSAVTGTFTVGQVTAVIAAVLGAGVGFVVLWWGARKLVNGIIGAFKTGKLKF